MNEIFSNETYKTSNSLLSLSLCILNDCKRGLREWLRERSEEGANSGIGLVRNPSGQVHDPSGARDPSEGLPQCKTTTGTTRQRGATCWAWCATRRAVSLQITLNLLKRSPSHKFIWGRCSKLEMVAGYDWWISWSMFNDWNCASETSSYDYNVNG